jgi:hypothetical protein
MRSQFRNWDSKISFFVFADIITGVSGILIFVTLMLATDLGKPAANDSQSADPAAEQQLQETLRQQLEADARNARLQELIAAAETAPAVEKLESDISGLRSQLSEARQKQAALAARIAGNQTDVLARDRTLGLTDVKSTIQRTAQETESLAKQDAKVRTEMASLEQRVGRLESQLLRMRRREGQLWLIPDKSSTTKEPLLVTVAGAEATIQRFDRPDQRKELEKSGADSAFRACLGGFKPLDQFVVFYIKPSGIELFESLVQTARAMRFEVGFDAWDENTPFPHFEIPSAADEPVSATNAPPAGPTRKPPPPGGASASITGAPPVTPAGQTTTNPPPTTQPPARPKGKNWWQRLLERIGLS